MQLQPVRDAGSSRRLAFVVVGLAACAIVAAGWLGSHPFGGTEGGPGTAARAAGPGSSTTDGPGPCLGPDTRRTAPAAILSPAAGSDVRAGGPIDVQGTGAPAGTIVQLTTSEGLTFSAPTDRLGDFSADVTFLGPTQPQAVSVAASAAGQDQRGASYCGAPLAAVSFTLLPGADMSIWSPAGSVLTGPSFVVSGATAGAIAAVRVRLESPDGSLIDERIVPTVAVADGDHAFRTPPLAVNRADLGPAILIITWTDPRTGAQAPELVRAVTLAAGPG